jgi:hypothetical protein
MLSGFTLWQFHNHTDRDILFSACQTAKQPRVDLEAAYEQPSVTSVFADQQFRTVSRAWPLSSQDPYLDGPTWLLHPRAPLSLSLQVTLELALSTPTHRTPGEPSHTTSVEQSGALVIVHLHGGLLTSAMPKTASPWPTLAMAIDQSASTYFQAACLYCNTWLGNGASR